MNETTTETLQIMKTLKDLPKQPSHIKPHPSIVYLGEGMSDFVPTINSETYRLNESGAWNTSGECFGSLKEFHYGIEFGSPEWNEWAKVIWDIKEDVPDDYIIIGPKVSDIVFRFKGIQYNDYRHLWDYFEDYAGDGAYPYAIHKDDPQVETLRKYLTGYSEEVSVETEESPYDKYKRACVELEEAKNNNWKIQHMSSKPRHIFFDDLVVLTKGKTWLFVNGDVLLEWDDYTIIKEDPKPSFEIEGDGNGPYKPEYHPYYWKFGCAEITHSLIKTLILADVYKMKVNKITIGKGEFTMDQLKELHEYHKKQ